MLVYNQFKISTIVDEKRVTNLENVYNQFKISTIVEIRKQLKM